MPKTKKKTISINPQEVLLHFENEMKQAGSFEEFLLEKKAMQSKGGINIIIAFPDIEKYRETFLTGKYETIRHLYNTEIPYIFWSKLYEELQTLRTNLPAKDLTKAGAQ